MENDNVRTFFEKIQMTNFTPCDWCWQGINNDDDIDTWRTLASEQLPISLVHVCSQRQAQISKREKIHSNWQQIFLSQNNLLFNITK